MPFRFSALLAVGSFVLQPAPAIAQGSQLSRDNPQGFADYLAKRGLVASGDFVGTTQPFISIVTPEEAALQAPPGPITEKIGFSIQILPARCNKKRCTILVMKFLDPLVDYAWVKDEDVKQWNITHKYSKIFNKDAVQLVHDVVLINDRIDQSAFDTTLLGWLTDFDEFLNRYYRPDPGFSRWPGMRVRVEPVPSYVAAYRRSLKTG